MQKKAWQKLPSRRDNTYDGARTMRAAYGNVRKNEEQKVFIIGL